MKKENLKTTGSRTDRKQIKNSERRLDKTRHRTKILEVPGHRGKQQTGTENEMKAHLGIKCQNKNNRESKKLKNKDSELDKSRHSCKSNAVHERKELKTRSRHWIKLDLERPF